MDSNADPFKCNQFQNQNFKNPNKISYLLLFIYKINGKVSGIYLKFVCFKDKKGKNYILLLLEHPK